MLLCPARFGWLGKLLGRRGGSSWRSGELSRQVGKLTWQGGGLSRRVDMAGRGPKGVSIGGTTGVSILGISQRLHDLPVFRPGHLYTLTFMSYFVAQEGR